MDRIFPDGINGFHQFSAHFAVKQAGEQDGLVERRFHPDGFAFHLAALRKREFTAWQAKRLSLMNQTTANPYCF